MIKSKKWPGFLPLANRRSIVEPEGEPLEGSEIFTRLADKLGFIPAIPESLYAAACKSRLEYGHSINDTVIIFDRVRENEAKMKRADSYEDMVDKSIWQTMRRSINTVVTVLIALLSVFILGGESTKIFSLAMLIGVFSGAYSSIFNASQILVEIKKHMKNSRGKRSNVVRA